ncbi:MAG: alpha-ketoacid dehydrogenase subunit beta, partial [Actinobacteria bacterium]|nr:alpha-ketoacid dehydrogenase subunit beta [Actinomycetota bacterium]
PISLSPLDEETILGSVKKTGRLVIVDEGNPRCGLAVDIAALVAQKAFGDLKAPVKCLTAPHTPVPFSPVLEEFYLPDVEKISKACMELLD